MTIVTTDLRRFGTRELRMAADLLKAYCDDAPDFLGDDLQIALNLYSGYVFLTDEDHNVAMMNGNRSAQFHSCPECGAEGFAEELPDEPCCQAYLRELQS